MADPAAEAPAWLVWLLAPVASGTSAYGLWQFVNARLQASKAEARAERKAATAEAAENDIIKTLREQVADGNKRLEEERKQRSEDVDFLKQQIAECRKEISELRGQLDEAFDARVQAMLEATKLRELNGQLETKINMQGREIEAHKATISTQEAKIGELRAAYSELSAFTTGLSLTPADRAADPCVKASAWLLNNRPKLYGAA